MSGGERMRLAVFASGGGSNFQAIADAVISGRLSADLALCLSNKQGAAVLDRALMAGVPTAVINPADFEDEQEYTLRLSRCLDEHHVNFVALAGYLKKIPSAIVRRFRHRMVNIHPALLPSFGGKGMYGRRVHEAVIEYGVRWSGATVHLVDEEYDTGPIVLQEPVRVELGDTAESLAERVLSVEHRLYPEALRLFAEGCVRVDGRRVTILESSERTERR